MQQVTTTNKDMAERRTKLPLKEWEETINKMSYEELQEYIEDPNICYPEFLELANKRIEELSSIPEHEVTKSMVKKAEKKTKSPLKEWKKAISLMSKDELQLVIEHPESYDPEYLKIVETNFKKLSSMPENEAMKVVVKRNLEAMGCPCEIDEDGDLSFFYQGEHFHAFIEETDYYITIWDFYWIEISLADTDKVRRLKHAINEANRDCTVNTYYEIDEEEKRIYASCHTSILYRPMITNLKDYLEIRLSNFFFAHDLVNAEMTLMEKREGKKETEQDSFNVDKLPIC